VHGPIACAGNSWNGRGSLSSGPTVYRRGLSTDLGEQDLVFGGEQRLYDAAIEIAGRFRPEAIFVYATCVTAMIGEDLTAVCAAAAAGTGLPVLPVPAPGFAGSKNLGNRLAGQVLLDHVIGTAEPAYRTPLDVNLVGEYNVAGELWAVTQVLSRIGVRVLSCVTGDARFRDIAVAHRARATMVVCSRALLGLARGLADRYGIPWFEGSFYGVRATGDSLRQFARLLDNGDPGGPGTGGGVRARTEAVIAESEALVASELAGYRERLRGARAVLYTGGVKSWSMVSALQDIGVEVVASGGTKSTPEDVGRIRALLGDDGQVITDGNPANLLEIVRRTGADILVAGGRNQYTALKARLPFVDVNQERHVPFTGYPGVVELARRVDRALNNPVWRAVRAPAPWDPPAGPWDPPAGPWDPPAGPWDPPAGPPAVAAIGGARPAMAGRIGGAG
jgi:nitrogenase molybdenum-cofactor synthesis protein NifE